MAAPAFTLIAGVEISNGTVGALAHGGVEAHPSWGDPVAAAEHWIAQGARWLHVGDLDAAAGTGDNAAAVARVLRSCRGRVSVALAGGIRDHRSLEAALGTSARQVVLDTAALTDREFVRQAFAAHGHRLAVAVTARGQAIHAPGTTIDGVDVLDVLGGLDADRCPAYVVTDVDSRGVRTSHGRALLTEACTRVHGAVIAGGGIDRLEDLHALVELVPAGLTGAVVDRALYTEAFTFAEALTAIEPRFDPYEWGPARP